MAIQFARIEIVSRKSGGNACCKAAYNARSKILDERTNINYNFAARGDNVHHEILLPEHVDKSFKKTEMLMNAVEQSEKKHNSQLLKDIVIALPDDKELSLQDRINITYKIIEEMEWVKNGLAVQMDIHQPHDGKSNWHAHLLVTTRRFTEDGKSLFSLKARDLNPEFKTGKNGNYIVPEEDIIHEKGKRIINNYFKELGLENRVDSIGIVPQEHIGPVRMRSILNQAMERNEQRKSTEIELLDTGQHVIDKVTRHMSVFKKEDLMRAVKVIDDDKKQEKLVEQALDKELVTELLEEDGKATGYYTTRGIRQEEIKILRLANYVATGSINNFTKTKSIATSTSQLIEESKSKLTDEQHVALSEILTSDRGLHILRGRAGVGKSHVLRQVSFIAREVNINTIGLAPTHKAKEVLSDAGFEQTDTVKGMLFKLHNARFSLPKDSLLVVDEAGMIGNDDYQELLRVAATRKCQVILSGDERQLASVQRGGMFKAFADQYGSSTILNIKRQAEGWGRQVSMAFSNGEVKSGVDILQQENRINWHDNLDESMQGLLADWSKSNYSLGDRLILAVKNKDVAALNHGAREYLKLKGALTGSEISVAGNYYMKGDRLLITESNKKLGLVNGELGVLQEVTKDKFTIFIDNQDKAKAKTVEFNPIEYGGFKHGYATTVFKAQGASIKDVYVCHNGFAGIRNSYVALSRNINELRLYANKEATWNAKSLINQLSHDPEMGSSLHFLTKAEMDLEKQEMEAMKNASFLDKIAFKAYNLIGRTITKLQDQYLPEAEYYNYQEPSVSQVNVSDVLDKIHDKYEQANNNREIQEEKLVVGGNIGINNNILSKDSASNDNVKLQVVATNINTHEISVSKEIEEYNNTSANLRYPNNPTTSSTKISSKDSFYARADYVRNESQRAEENKERYRSEVDSLRRELSIKAESIVLDLLGEPNKRMSTRSMYKYGNNGSLAIKVGGNKAGVWYDFSKGEGGDLFDLVQQEKNLDFKESVDYLKDKLGIRKHNLQLVENHRISDKYADYHKNKATEQAVEAAKIQKAENLYARSKTIEQSSTASRYLANIRKIDIDFDKEGAKSDIRTAYIYDKSLGKKTPVLVGFARNQEGQITGGQQILLDSKSANKVDITTPKKSFGKIAGSFVTIHTLERSGSDQLRGKETNLTVIAEGIETALSLKDAGINANIVCALGINNIKNYWASANEKIIIAADNDGAGSNTYKTIESAVEELTNKGAFVKVVRPQEKGDFNDILQKHDVVGKLMIQEQFEPTMSKLSLYTSKDLEIISRYEQLNSPKTDIKEFFSENKQIEQNLLKFNPKYDMNQLACKLEDFQDRTRHELLEYEQYSQFKPYLSTVMEQFNKEKSACKTLQEYLAISFKEKEFCISLHKNHQEQMTMVGLDGYNQAIATYHMHDRNPNVIDNIEKYYIDAQIFKAGSEERIMYELHDKRLPLNSLADSIFNRNQEFVVETIKSNLDNIDKFGSTFIDNIKYTNKVDLLNSYTNDKLLGIYGRDFANKEISKIQEVESFKRLEHTKQIEEKQKEQGIANEPVARQKSYDFELD